MVTQCSQAATAGVREESRYLSSPVYPGLSLQFEQHYSDSASSIPLVENLPANAIKISVAI